MIEEGRYLASVIGAEVSESKAGNPQVAVEISVTHRTVAETDQALPSPQQRRVFWSLTEAAWPYTKERLKALGFNGDFEAPEFSVEETHFDCRHDEYGGKLREKWDIAREGPAPAAKATKAQLTAMWKRETGGLAPATPVKTPPEAPKDDLPF